MSTPTMRLRGNVWVADLYDRAGNRFRVSTKVKGADNEAQAREVARQKQAAMNEGERVTSAPRGPTLRKAWDTCETLYFRTECAKSLKTIGYHRAAVFDAITEGTLLSELSLDHYEALARKQREKGNGDNTIGKVFQTLGRVLAFAVEKKLVAEVVPVLKFKKPKGRIREYTLAEEKAIIEAFAGTYPEMVDLTVLLVDTGMRLGEAMGHTTGLLVHERTPRPRVLLRDPDQIKNSEPRVVPLTARADAALARWIALDPPLTKDAIEYRWQVMRRNLKQAKDREFVIHALRHTCCTRLIRAGMDISKVQKWMGHKDINSTLRYTHLNSDDLEGGVALLESVTTVPATVPANVPKCAEEVSQ
jgi:integrase